MQTPTKHLHLRKTWWYDLAGKPLSTNINPLANLVRIPDKQTAL